MILKLLRQQLSDVLDWGSRKLEIEQEFSHYSRTRLCLMLKESRKELKESRKELKECKIDHGTDREDTTRKIIRLLDDIESVARYDLTVEIFVTNCVYGAIASNLESLIKNYTEVVKQLPEESPLRKKYKMKL